MDYKFLRCIVSPWSPNRFTNNGRHYTLTERPYTNLGTSSQYWEYALIFRLHAKNH